MIEQGINYKQCSEVSLQKQYFIKEIKKNIKYAVKNLF